MRVGITGHQAMPEKARIYADTIIEQFITSHKDIEGISSLAVGADQLFAQKITEAERPLHALIPCEGYESTFDNEHLSTYNELLAAAATVEVLEFTSPSEEAFYAAGRRIVEQSDILLAVWDGKEAQGLGGTADVVRYAHSLDKVVSIIWPEGVER